MKKFIAILILLGFGLFQLAAQNIDKYSDTQLVYATEFMMAAKIHTQGYGIDARWSKIKDIRTTSFWEVGIQEIKHPKESRQQSTILDPNNRTPRSYIFGKQNNFYNINVLRGKQKTISEKGRKNPVAISYIYKGGISLGLLKPYYLTIDYRIESTSFQDEKYDDTPETGNANFFLNPNRIFASSGFSYGLNELKVIPGIVLEGGFLFDWSKTDEKIRAVELGAMVNAYYKRVPIMIEATNNLVFTNVYARLWWGNRAQ